ncbi:MFS transporter [Mumia zhuanghuii]|uniref:MFS transporter n=1 Tax=Mumia zhuanghuii TaxID=2585211 RepID=UPI0018917009|nr:MFS transporter [Mumia zhuanghuii]
MTSAEPSPDAARLRDPRHLPFVVGALALVTLGAFENRATLAILPTVADHLDGLDLFGAAAAAPLVASVIAMVVAGQWCDRRGPAPALLGGAALFAAAQLAMAAAPTIGVFVVGRLTAGVGEAFLDIALTVMIARMLPAALRPAMFGAMATAWVVPSLIGPPLAGAVAEHLGWRAVFAGAIVLMAPAMLCLAPSVRRLRDSAPDRAGASGSTEGSTEGSSSARARHRAAIGSAVLVTLGLAVLAVGGPAAAGDTFRSAGVLALVVGTALVVVGIRRVLPSGTLRAARGLPATVALRGTQAAAFAGAGSFIPLMLTQVHGLRPAVAGLSLTITGLFWAAGSQLNGTRLVQRRTTTVGRMRLSLGLIATGIVGPVLLALDVIPVWCGLAVWALAGTGMGIGSPTLANHVLTLAPTEAQGRMSSAAMLSATVAQSVYVALAGAVLAGGTDPAPRLALVLAVAAVLAALSAALAPRLAPPVSRRRLPNLARR